MKSNIKIESSAIFLISFVFLIFQGCRPDSELIITKLQTGSISQLTDSSATASATFTDIGDNIGNYGHCWATHSNPAISDKSTILHGINNNKSFSSQLSGLDGNTKYFLRAYAKDGNQIFYGGQIEFTTPATPFISIKSPTTATHWLAGEEHLILWDDNIAENVNISLFQNNVLFKSIVSNYSSTGSYTWIVPSDIVYGNDYQIKISGTVTGKAVDLSPNFKMSEKHGSSNNFVFQSITYKTKKIGTQWWMSENLKTTKYNDGNDIPYQNTSWAGLTTPAYRDYPNANDNVTYGFLYNWYAANTGKLCPAGWHVPSTADWDNLCQYYAGNSLAGGALKEAGTLHWTSPNTGASNESGFNALPGGYHLSSITAMGTYGSWWSSNQYDSNNAVVIGLNNSNTYVNSNNNSKSSGSSIRCVRD